MLKAEFPQLFLKADVLQEIILFLKVKLVEMKINALAHYFTRVTVTTMSAPTETMAMLTLQISMLEFFVWFRLQCVNSHEVTCHCLK